MLHLRGDWWGAEPHIIRGQLAGGAAAEAAVEEGQRRYVLP